MTRQNFELGVWRLYHVAWLLLLGSVLVVTVADNLRVYKYGDVEVLAVVLPIAAAALLPLVGKYVVRWIYRGFFPKA